MDKQMKNGTISGEILLDACGVCNGDGVDADNDGVCDDVECNGEAKV